METNKLCDYMENETLDIDMLIDDYYSYIYIVVKNGISINISQEDMEEIISDTFVAFWKNSKYLRKDLLVKPYLKGIAKNLIKNKYRDNNINVSIENYENTLVEDFDIDDILESNEKNELIIDTLKTLNKNEYSIFMMYYYEGKNIKEISKELNLSVSNVKTILHRVRKKIKRNLEDGGYSYGK